MNEPQPPVEQPAPNFLQLLAAHANGYTAGLLTDKVKDLVEHLETLATNEGLQKSKGTLTIKVVFERDGGPYKVSVEPTLKLPVGQIPKSVFYATAAHGLVQQDPRQYRMPFSDVNRRSGAVVDIATGQRPPLT